MPAKRLALPFLLAGAFVLLSTMAADARPRPEAYTLPGPTVYPEGVTFDQQTQTFYVSSTTDGAIFRGTLDEEATEVFLAGGTDGRTTATGLDVDGGLLFVSGGASGKMFVYDASSGDLVADFATSRTPTFINDVVVVDGSAYFTDSRSPFLYRVFEGEDGWEMEEWRNFSGTAFEYTAGFNANGIVASADGRYLVIIQSSTGELFRVEIATKEVEQIELPTGTDLTRGDGLVLRGRALWVVRNMDELIVKVQLAGDLSSGEVLSETTDASFMFPTTAAIANGRLLVVNSQFDRRATNNPVLPFTVSSVEVP